MLHITRTSCNYKVIYDCSFTCGDCRNDLDTFFLFLRMCNVNWKSNDRVCGLQRSWNFHIPTICQLLVSFSSNMCQKFRSCFLINQISQNSQKQKLSPTKSKLSFPGLLDGGRYIKKVLLLCELIFIVLYNFKFSGSSVSYVRYGPSSNFALIIRQT